MSGAPVYYRQHKLPLKNWQRILLGVVFSSGSFYVSTMMHDIMMYRFGRCRGKTMLYGDSTQNGGRQLEVPLQN